MHETGHDEYSYELLDRLKKHPLLKSLKEKGIDGIIKFSKLVKFKGEEPIFSEGQFDNCFYILLSGSLRIVKGNETLCFIRRSGEIFGEMSITDASGRSASVFAESPAQCLLIDMSFTESLPKDQRESFLFILYRAFVEVLTSRLKKTNDELIMVKKELERQRTKRTHPKLKQEFGLTYNKTFL